MTLRQLSLYAVIPVACAFGLLLLGAQSADAATYYYVGTTDNWGTDASWNSSAGACDDSGDGAVPTSADDVVFSSACTTSVAIDASANVASLTLATGYSGTVTSGSDLDIDGTFEITAGTFDLNGEDMTVGGDFVVDDTFTHSNGSVTLDGSNQSVNTVSFYDLTKTASSASTLTVESGETVTVSNALTLTGSSGSLIFLESNTSGSAGAIAAGAATKTLSFLSVKDITSSGGIMECTTGCINRGNNNSWIFSDEGSSSDNESGAGSVVAVANLMSPGSGDRFDGGDAVAISYTAGEDDLDSIALYYSLDGGSTFELIADGLENTGSYTWEAANASTLKAVIKLALLNADGEEILSDVSSRFRINAVDIAEEVEEDVEEEMGGEAPAQEEEEAFVSIDLLRADGSTVTLTPGSLFRGESLSGVYMVNADGTRSVFPNDKVFFSHGYSFDDVEMLQDDQLAALDLGSRVTMAAGELVKIQSDARVFRVDAGGVLRHVPDEDTAIALFGEDWADLVSDINVVFWGDYTMGSAL